MPVNKFRMKRKTCTKLAVGVCIGFIIVVNASAFYRAVLSNESATKDEEMDWTERAVALERDGQEIGGFAASLGSRSNSILASFATPVSSPNAIFSKFPQWDGEWKQGASAHDSVTGEGIFLGILPSCKRVGSCGRVDAKPRIEYPRLRDHTFEWLDQMVMFLNAEPTGVFNMLELGAGPAVWSMYGLGMARMRKFPEKGLHIIGVEAQPKHCDWGEDHIAFNNGAASTTLVCAAVADEDGFVEFPTHPKGEKWGYGIQHLVDEKHDQVVGAGGEIVKRPAFKFCTLVHRSEFEGSPVDFVSLDVQSYEHKILDSANPGILQCLNESVRMIHISLHRSEANDARKLTETFVGSLGWNLVRYLPVMTNGVSTSFGKIDFVDGVLSFVNPYLTPPDVTKVLYDERNIHKGTYTTIHEKLKAKNPATSPDWSLGDFITDIKPRT